MKELKRKERSITNFSSTFPFKQETSHLSFLIPPLKASKLAFVCFLFSTSSSPNQRTLDTNFDMNSSVSEYKSVPGPAPVKRTRLIDINEWITCYLCGGYLIDAMTLIECQTLHSFCKSCIYKHLQNMELRGMTPVCPTCDEPLNESKPHISMRQDTKLQDIVYKLVPGLYKREMERRREFYKKLGSQDPKGEVKDSLFYVSQDKISLSLEYHLSPTDTDSTSSSYSGNLANNGTNNKRKSDGNGIVQQSSERRYLLCEAGMPVYLLKKFIVQKYSLDRSYQVHLMYNNYSLTDDLTLMDVIYIYSWCSNDPMRFYYTIEKSNKKLKSASPITVETCEREEETVNSPGSKGEEGRDSDKDISCEKNKAIISPLSNCSSDCSLSSVSPKSKHHHRHHHKKKEKIAKEPKATFHAVPTSRGVTIKKDVVSPQTSPTLKSPRTALVQPTSSSSSTVTSVTSITTTTSAVSSSSTTVTSSTVQSTTANHVAQKSNCFISNSNSKGHGDMKPAPKVQTAYPKVPSLPPTTSSLSALKAVNGVLSTADMRPGASQPLLNHSIRDIIGDSSSPSPRASVDHKITSNFYNSSNVVPQKSVPNSLKSAKDLQSKTTPSSKLVSFSQSPGSNGSKIALNDLPKSYNMSSKTLSKPVSAPSKPTQAFLKVPPPAHSKISTATPLRSSPKPMSSHESKVTSPFSQRDSPLALKGLQSLQSMAMSSKEQNKMSSKFQSPFSANVPFSFAPKSSPTLPAKLPSPLPAKIPSTGSPKAPSPVLKASSSPRAPSPLPTKILSTLPSKDHLLPLPKTPYHLKVPSVPYPFPNSFFPLPPLDSSPIRPFARRTVHPPHVPPPTNHIPCRPVATKLMSASRPAPTPSPTSPSSLSASYKGRGKLDDVLDRLKSHNQYNTISSYAKDLTTSSMNNV